MNSDQADILDLLAGHTDDSTIERLAFECLMTSLTDDRVASLMNVLGWRGDFDCFAIGGTPETSPASASLVARKAVRDLGGEHAIVGTYGSFLLALVCQMGAATAEVTPGTASISDFRPVSCARICAAELGEWSAGRSGSKGIADQGFQSRARAEHGLLGPLAAAQGPA